MKVTYLKERRTDGLLCQNVITSELVYESWQELAVDFWAQAAARGPQISKYDTASFAVCSFVGNYRSGGSCNDDWCLWIGDIDNSNPDKPKISFQEAHEALKSLGFASLGYVSYSHTPSHPKIRVMVPISRTITSEEAGRLGERLNGHLGCQLDSSIYGLGGHIYGPPWRGQWDWLDEGDLWRVADGERVGWIADGSCLDVEQWLARQPMAGAEMVLPNRAPRPRGARTAPTSPPSPTPMVQGPVAPVVGPVSIYNPNVCRVEWLDEWDAKAIGGSQHQTMMSVLRKIFIRTGGQLSREQLLGLLDELDRRPANAGHIRRTYEHALEGDLKTIMEPFAYNPTARDLRYEKLARRFGKYK